VNLLRSAATVSVLTLVSRVFGYVRDILIAAALGAGPVMQAYVVAFKLPNLFRALFAEGAFNAAFVPFFSKKLVEGEAEAMQAASMIFHLQWMVVLGFVAISEIAMPLVVIMLAPGFSQDAELLALTTKFARITMPYLWFIALVSMLASLLQCKGRFAAASAAPIILNLCMILGLLSCRYMGGDAGLSLVWSIEVAGALQLVSLWWACRRIGLVIHWRKPIVTPEVKTMFKAMVPGLVGSAGTQLNLLINTMIASWVSGALAYLYYADRMMQLPLALIGTALGTALLPLLSQHLRRHEEKQAQVAQNRAVEFGLLLTLPCAGALGVLALPIITILFERGAFTASESIMTAKVLQAFVTGLPAFVLVKLLTPAFFARGDTKTPVRIALSCILVNLAFNAAMVPWLGTVAIALSTAFTAWANTGWLIWVLYQRRHWHMDKALWTRLWRMLLATLLMMVVLALAMQGAETWLAHAHLGRRVIALMAVMFAGGVSYLAAAHLLGACAFKEWWQLLRR
jgi:putative peptidoglycan lipid II flippase